MPKIRIEPRSQSGRPILDRIATFILESSQGGLIRDERDIAPGSKRLMVDAAPANYGVQFEINGFHHFIGKFKIEAQSGPVVPVELAHLSKAMPGLQDLSKEQKRLLASDGSSASTRWAGLSDNQAGTFFQISHALSKRLLGNGRGLSSYVETVRVIGGSEISDDIPDGKIRSETGWRMHVTINPEDRQKIESDIVENGVFGPRERSAHRTHKRFGLVFSHRETGPLPRIQVVFDEKFEHADVDLDVVLHRSSPHEVFREFKKKFPEATENFKF